MTLYSKPPSILPFEEVKPSLLVCWWTTIFCTTIILFRVGGRYIRTERLFTEDKTAALAMVPLFLRMGCVHLVLVYGTNNADFSRVELSEEDVRRRSIGSGLVLASRVFYAATLWILKNASLDFFKRLIGVTWKKSYIRMLFYIRCILFATFVAVIISDFTECQPFSSYWQVLPDPGGQCRQGYAQLLTMAACNVLTDLLLVFFPIPIILRSSMTAKRKLQLVALFSLSLAIIAITLYRVPNIIWAQGSQQLRSVLASVEILFATAAANALVLGSFVRDRGVKKRKFKKYEGSFADSMDRAGGHGPPHQPGATAAAHRPTIHHHWGSDEDLVRDLGLGVEPALRKLPDSEELDQEAMLNQRKFTPAPPVAPDMSHWRFPSNRHSGGSGSSVRKHASMADGSDASLLCRDNMGTIMATRSNSAACSRKLSFFDVGGLLDDVGTVSSGGVGRESYHSGIDPLSPLSGPFVGAATAAVAPLNNYNTDIIKSSNSSSNNSNYSSNGPIPSPALPASNSGFRRGSTALLQDLGGLLPLGNSRHHRPGRSSRGTGTELQPIPQGRLGGLPDLVDAGGLLDRQC